MNELQPERFLKNHPCYGSRQARLVAEEESLVPNFIGGALPRKDAGNREEYCLTMLTLFKPWRSGADLKQDKDTLWHDAFENHSFTDRQRDVMKFFHLRYECNDARDDFSKARRAGLDGNAPSFAADMKTLDELDDQHYANQGLDGLSPDEDLIGEASEWEQLGSRAQLRLAHMMQAENIMHTSGWLDSLPAEDKDAVAILKEPMIRGDHMKASEWRNLLTEKRQEILRAREEQAVAKNRNASTNGGMPEDKYVNVVKVIDQSYLDKNFKAKCEADQTLINSTVAKFSLNKEQERAFRIVANHATDPPGEQLKMYLGGMAGTGKSQVIMQRQ